MARVAPFAFASAAVCLSGCGPHTTPAPDGAVRSRAVSATNAPALATSAGYRSAADRFHRGDVAGALTALDALARNPPHALSAADRVFLARQQAICRDRLAPGLKPSGGTFPSPVVASVSRRPHPASVPPRVLSAASADCGPRALLLVCESMGVRASLPALRSAAGTTGDGTNLAGLVRAARSVGLTAEGVQMDGAALANLSQPALAWVDGNHYVAVLSVEGDREHGTATIHDPSRDAEEVMSLAAGPTGLLERSGGILLLLSRQYKQTRQSKQTGGGGEKTLAAIHDALGATP